MKRAYAILMFSILFVNSAGFYVYYVLELQRIHAEMRDQLKYLPEEQLETLHLTYQQFVAARVEDHEVKVNAKMYDIARIEVKGNNVKVFCVHDELEDNFLALFGELVSKPLEDTSSIPSTVVDFIQMNFLVHRNTIEFRNSFATITPGFSYRILRGIFVSEIQTPPPKI